LADFFSTRSEGVGGRRAVEWRLVDEVVPRPAWDETVAQRAAELAARSSRPSDGVGIALTTLVKEVGDASIAYPHVSAALDRETGVAHITVRGPATPPPATSAELHDLGPSFWTLAVVRELDDLILDLRTNESEIGTWVFHTVGDPRIVLAFDHFLLENQDDWLAKEILLYLKRTLKRLDVTSRSLISLVEPGSCFAGSLLELVLASDRSFQLSGMVEEGEDEAEPATLTVGAANLGPLPMGNGLSRLQSRFFGDDAALAEATARLGEPVGGEEALEIGLVTFAPDDIDWEDEVRIALEERSSFSPDALTGLEANLRFVGPETLETKIFSRLTAWQNWIFVRPNASGPEGALRRYGTGQRATFDRKRV
jgi:benzoyl-CoA-dihydrodiol lyase